ncbi:MAG TPA: DUF2442 domain-containing protein [Polyangiales bacterium]|nr:DUF2442 domain-containing protein [Polyangiales bacterium]
MVHVIAVRYLDGWNLDVEFDDDTVGVVNLQELVERVPLFAPLQNQAQFARAFVEDGRVCWPGDVDIAPERLYALAHGLPAPESLEQARANERTMRRRQSDPGWPPVRT